LPGIACPNNVGVVSTNHESLLSCLHKALIKDKDVYDSDIHTHTNVGSIVQSKECKVSYPLINFFKALLTVIFRSSKFSSHWCPKKTEMCAYLYCIFTSSMGKET